MSFFLEKIIRVIFYFQAINTYLNELEASFLFALLFEQNPEIYRFHFLLMLLIQTTEGVLFLYLFFLRPRATALSRVISRNGSIFSKLYSLHKYVLYSASRKNKFGALRAVPW